jgi:hypothetical protein
MAIYTVYLTVSAMQVVNEILIETAIYLLFVLVVVAFIYSAMILFQPKVALWLNAKFDSWYSTKNVDDTFDTHIDTDQWVLNNRWWVGSLFLLGALFTLKYILLDFDANKFITLVVRPDGQSARTFSEIVVVSIQWLLAFTSFVGVLACAFFLVNPEKFQRFSKRLDHTHSTTYIKEKADTVSTALDDWVMKNHIMVGLFLLLGSTYLVIILLMTII